MRMSCRVLAGCLLVGLMPCLVLAQTDDKEVRIPFTDTEALQAIDELGALVGVYEETSAEGASVERLEELVKRLGDGVELEKTEDGAVIVVRKLTVRKRTRQWRSQFREWLRQSFPEATAKIEANYGWRRWIAAEGEDEEATRVRLADDKIADGRVVILVHGLDEPGLLWAQVCHHGYSLQ